MLGPQPLGAYHFLEARQTWMVVSKHAFDHVKIQKVPAQKAHDGS